MNNVIQLHTPEQRAAVIADILREKAELIPINSTIAAVRWGDAWMLHAQRMELLYSLACIQRDSSNMLLRIAEEELERLRNTR